MKEKFKDPKKKKNSQNSFGIQPRNQNLNADQKWVSIVREQLGWGRFSQINKKKSFGRRMLPESEFECRSKSGFVVRKNQGRGRFCQIG